MGKEELSMPQTNDISEAGHVGLTAEAAVRAVKGGRAKDVDIAANFIAGHGGDGTITWTVEEEKKLIRKVDWHLIPIVSLAALRTHQKRTLLTHCSFSSAQPCPAWIRRLFQLLLFTVR
jgi:hypothetical protein